MNIIFFKLKFHKISTFIKYIFFKGLFSLNFDQKNGSKNDKTLKKKPTECTVLSAPVHNALQQMQVV